jgi:peroxiredoxin
MKVLDLKQIRISIFFLSVLLTVNLNGSEAIFSQNIFDINGDKLSFLNLSKDKIVCLITIKSITCPICIEQLERIKKKVLDFEKCNLTFLVLAPGPLKGIKAFAKKMKFPFPFIQDKNFSISKIFNLANPPFEIIPAVILFEKNGFVKWRQLGRSFDYFSDQALEDYLDCENWI